MGGEEVQSYIKQLFVDAEEHPKPLQTKVIGSIPDWVTGDLLRVGPGQFHIGSDAYQHLFDALAIIQKFSFRHGKITYQTKYLQSNAYKQSNEQKRIVFSEFGTKAHPDPTKNIISRAISQIMPLNFSDNGLINLIMFPGEVFASTETGIINQVVPQSLDTGSQVDIKKYVSVNTCSAHPMYEADGTMYNIGSSFTHGAKYCVIKFPVPRSDMPEVDREHYGIKNAQIVASIPARSWTHPSYYHSFGMSENYIVLIEQPYLISISRLLTSGIRNQPLSECLDWAPHKPCYIHVVDKRSAARNTFRYTCSAMLIFHHINAYEDNGFLVVDVIGYDDASVVSKLFISFLTSDKLRDPSAWTENESSIARRLVLPLRITKQEQDINLVTLRDTKAKAYLKADGSVHCEWELIGKDRGYELPVVNTTFAGRKYRYFYACGTFDLHSSYHNSICKIDTAKKTSTCWRGEEHQFCSEPMFIRRPADRGQDAMEEDDGVLICGVSDKKDGAEDFVVIIDAKSMSEIGRASIPQPGSIPYGMHGIFLPQD